jgi:uroporphyrinogen decarboxylase
MREMSSYERVKNTLERKPVDKLAIALSPWQETLERWRSQGHLKEGEDVFEKFGQDLRGAGWWQDKMVANLDYKEQVLEETEDTLLKRDGNGATLRWHKKHEGAPEHVDFLVKDRKGWQEHIKPFLSDVDRRRIPFEQYRKEKAFSAQKKRFFYWYGAGPFELIHPVCGHEYMLMGMALDPQWVKEMVTTYVGLTIALLEVLFAEEGTPDGFFIYEDLGYKLKPFISPAMYKDIMFPGHKRLFDYAHAKGCNVIVHSCGYVEPLVPGLIEAGMDCLQAIEVKAGMDLPTLFRKFGDKIAFFGGIDARVLATNDKAQINRELLKKIPPVVDNGGSYILHSDHSEPPEVEWETMEYFFNRGREIAAGKI